MSALVNGNTGNAGLSTRATSRSADAAECESDTPCVKAAAPSAVQGAQIAQPAETPAAQNDRRPFFDLMYEMAAQDAPAMEDAAPEGTSAPAAKPAQDTGATPATDAAPSDNSLPGMAMLMPPVGPDAPMQLQLVVSAALTSGGKAQTAAADVARPLARSATIAFGVTLPAATRDNSTEGAVGGAKPSLPFTKSAAAVGPDLQIPPSTDKVATPVDRAYGLVDSTATATATATAAASPRNLRAVAEPELTVASSSQREPIATSTAAQPMAASPPSGADALTSSTLKLPVAAPAQWRQPLAEALGDRLQLQVNRNVEQAVIRLDPPMLGRIDISIRHEAGTLQVHISASNAEVLRQLHSTGEGLRQDMEQRQGGSVSVLVSDSNHQRGGDPRQRPRQADADDEPPGKALAEAERGQAASFASSSRTEPGSP